MMINFFTLVVLALASYRVVRFLIFDTLIEHSRQKFYTWLSNASLNGYAIKKGFAHWFLGAISCSWCLGVYVTFAIYWLYIGTYPQNWGRLGWLNYVGITGLQGLIHAVEPDDE